MAMAHENEGFHVLSEIVGKAINAPIDSRPLRAGAAITESVFFILDDGDNQLPPQADTADN